MLGTRRNLCYLPHLQRALSEKMATAKELRCLLKKRNGFDATDHAKSLLTGLSEIRKSFIIINK